tara:strand:- start:929 stop:1780 length:852 start_codon:yes stop_codon:yes gene_type:complete
MTEYEQYLFDLNGYILVEGALSVEQVAAMNNAIDHNSDQIHIRTREQALDGSLEEQGGQAAENLKGTQGRGDFGNFLFWEDPWCRVFRDVITLPTVMNIMLSVIGPRFRLTGTAGISMTKGSEGFIFHGGGSPELDHMREIFYHRFENGRMNNGLMSVSYSLCDVGPGDGGFACIPGSHKANFLCPIEVRRLEIDLGCIEHIPMKAGDAVIFTEALTHGTLPWTAAHERRLLRYLYSPTSHLHTYNQEWEKIELSDLERALVGPPSHPGADIGTLLNKSEKNP